METITIKRTGDAPLVFSGEVIAEQSGQWGNGRELNRWFDLRIYSTSGREFVAEASYQTRWRGETDRTDAFVGKAKAVAAWLTEYDPQNCVEGFPSGESYRKRQEQLLRTICDHYESRVGELLATAAAKCSDFAASPEQAVEEQYWQMDHEAIMGFVRSQLAEFSLTQAEACVICDANNGAMLFPDHCWSGLAANIWDTPAKSLSEKWQCDADDVARRIQSADRGTQFAIAFAVAQFWRHCAKETSEALRLAGFSLRSEQ